MLKRTISEDLSSRLAIESLMILKGGMLQMSNKRYFLSNLGLNCLAECPISSHQQANFAYIFAVL